jgi:hypothetical protein
MRPWIIVGALLMVVIIMAARPATPEVIVRERRVEVPVPFRVEVPVEVTRAVEKASIEPRANLEKEPRPQAPASQNPGMLLAHEKMLFLFERELDLKPEHRRFMEAVLTQREKEIAAYQKDIIASGIFRVREYEYRVKAMQAVSYEKMGEVLEGAQRQRFACLVGEGRLGDAVAFEVPNTLVVIQD